MQQCDNRGKHCRIIALHHCRIITVNVAFLVEMVMEIL